MKTYEDVGRLGRRPYTVPRWTGDLMQPNRERDPVATKDIGYDATSTRVNVSAIYIRYQFPSHGCVAANSQREPVPWPMLVESLMYQLVR